MITDIQNTDLYKKFKKALNITSDMRPDDNPFVVECCKIAEEYAQSKQKDKTGLLNAYDNYVRVLKSKLDLINNIDNIRMVDEWDKKIKVIKEIIVK